VGGIHHLRVKPLREEGVRRSLKLLNMKWIVDVGYRRTRIDISCTLGGSAPGEREGGELKLPKPE
jgi:hypothetical protein